MHAQWCMLVFSGRLLLQLASMYKCDCRELCATTEACPNRQAVCGRMPGVTCGSVCQEDEAGAGPPHRLAGCTKAFEIWDQAPPLRYICHRCALPTCRVAKASSHIDSHFVVHLHTCRAIYFQR